MTDDPDMVSEAAARLGAVLRGKYRLDAVLGIGGMATVYAATHRNRAELAIKILHPDLAADPALRARFLREAYAANSVKHASVVRIVDDDVTEDGSAFLVMERLRGIAAEDLRERCGGKLAPHAAVSIVEQLLDALGAAHAASVVHRDVKPANLFVTHEGEVKVLDFGIGRTREALAGALSLTGAATIMGTPSYMAPEQALPGMTEIDARTDVWAAGATLFVLLSGRPVHEAESIGELVVKAAMNRARSLASLMPRAPRALVEVVDVALAFEKSQRWASAAEMRAALLAAHRLHFGRAPSRTSLARLVETFSSDAAAVETAPTHALAGAVTRITPLPRQPRASVAPSSPPGSAEGPAFRSRTSIPIASDVGRATKIAPGLPGIAWVASAFASGLVIAWAAQWTTSRGSVAVTAVAASPAPAEVAEVVDASTDAPAPSD